MQGAQSKPTFLMWGRGTIVEMTPQGPLSRSTQSRVRNTQDKCASSALAGKKTGYIQGSWAGRDETELCGREYSPHMIYTLLSLSLFYFLFSFAFLFCLLIFSQLLLLSYFPYLFPNSLFSLFFFSFSLFPHSLPTFFTAHWLSWTGITRGKRYSQNHGFLKHLSYKRVSRYQWV